VLALIPPGGDSPESGVDDLLAFPPEPAILLARVRSLLATQQRCLRMEAELRRLAQIGIDLSAERDLKRLLGKIVAEARTINDADAGSLYIVDHDAGVLRFEVAQNESLGLRLGAEDNLPPVPLDPRNVSAYVALSGEVVNIPDVYEAEGFDFSGPRRYDALTGYRSRSMLVVPIGNHEGETIAVLQIINAQEPETRRVVPFSTANVERTRGLASHAGVALTNVQLFADQQALLEGLIHSLADAVDEKSPYTAGHIRRVTELAVSLAAAVNNCADGRFQGEQFGPDALETLRVAGLLHDIGKIVIPEHIVDKATKLECIHDRIAEIRLRFSVIRRGLESSALHEKLALTRAGASSEAYQAIEAELQARLAALSDDFRVVEAANTGGEGMSDEQCQRLRRIAAQTYRDDEGMERPYLTENELYNLCIRRGTLLPEELEVIRSHAAVSSRILRRIPFPRKLRQVPLIAADHHEALDGSGYPLGKTADQLPLPSRILAVADIFDALTASDRPYKKAFPLETAYRILRENAARGKLDARLVELFIQSRCHTVIQEEPRLVERRDRVESLEGIDGMEGIEGVESMESALGGTRRTDLERIG
jgi:HD-GYP domain-containing protein (c-di-GMP phosphodiesterase class II)